MTGGKEIYCCREPFVLVELGVLASITKNECLTRSMLQHRVEIASQNENGH